MISLNCPLIFLDTETTGTNSIVDRVVEIGLVKFYPDGSRTEWSSRVNPEMPIPPESSRIHGIRDEDVKGAPIFRDLAGMLATGFDKSDYGGHNVNFDLKMLNAEFARVGHPFRFNGRLVDTSKIFHRFHRRRLTDAAKLYVGEEFPEAHRALDDAVMSSRVFEAQLARHEELPRTIEELHREFFEKCEGDRVDPEGKLVWRYGEASINFGKKEVGQPLRKVPRSFLRWMLKGDFSAEVKRIVRDILEHEKFPERRAE